MDDIASRRAYWTAQMDAADEFMRRVLRYPVAECGEPVVSLRDAASADGVEVAFADQPHANGRPRLFYLRAGLIPGFLAAVREMNRRGWVLRVEDAYRTPEMQAALGRSDPVFRAVLRMVQWECGRERPPPDLLFRRLGALVANVPKVGTHLSGSALDISVVSRATGAEVDRGAPYLTLSECTPMDSPFILPEAREARRAITEIMRRHGFVTYPWEFWHYNSGDAYAGILHALPGPARYGAVELEPDGGRVTPVVHPLAPLTPIEVVETRMADLLNGKHPRRV